MYLYLEFLRKRNFLKGGLTLQVDPQEALGRPDPPERTPLAITRECEWTLLYLVPLGLPAETALPEVLPGEETASSPPRTGVGEEMNHVLGEGSLILLVAS